MFNDNSAGLQLLPETRRKIDVYIPGQNRWLVIAGGWVGLVLLIWGGLYFYERSVQAKIVQADADLKKIEAARKTVDEEKLLKLKEAITAAKPILANHVIWSVAFDRVQRLILPEVQFVNFAVKLEKQEYVFKAVTSSFGAVAKQIAAFNPDEAITNVDVSKISAKPDGRVEFDATLKLDLVKINHPSTKK